MIAVQLSLGEKERFWEQSLHSFPCPFEIYTAFIKIMNLSEPEEYP
jgi:hypothetical protein